MPMQKDLYPPNWKAIALEIKQSAGWYCQECDRPCRRPGESWAEFQHRMFVNHDYPVEEFVEKKGRFVLTTAHLDHNPANCDRSNLKALCSVCHLRYDAQHHMRSRNKNKQSK